jgi:hypothetical protein
MTESKWSGAKFGEVILNGMGDIQWKDIKDPNILSLIERLPRHSYMMTPGYFSAEEKAYLQRELIRNTNNCGPRIWDVVNPILTSSEKISEFEAQFDYTTCSVQEGNLHFSQLQKRENVTPPAQYLLINKNALLEHCKECKTRIAFKCLTRNDGDLILIDAWEAAIILTDVYIDETSKASGKLTYPVSKDDRMDLLETANYCIYGWALSSQRRNIEVENTPQF